MKNSNIIFNTLLGVAVLVLYILHFSTSKEKATESDARTEKTKERKEVAKKITEKGGLNIAFVDVDSINAKYEFVKESQKNAESKARVLQAEFREKQKKLQQEIALYYQTAPSMTLEKAKAKEEELKRKQQEFQMESQSRSNSVMKQEQKLQEKIFKNIKDFIEGYAEKNDYDYILTYSGLLAGTVYGNPTLNVTDDIIEGLNKEYRAEEKKGKKK